MENNDLLQPQLQVDGTASAHLLETAKWAKFLAIVGFIGCAIILAFGLFFGAIMGAITSRSGSSSPLTSVYGGSMASVMAVVYALIGLLYFFPCLLLYRFATKMKMALQSSDQFTLNESLSNLRRVYKFMGILIIILLSFYALVIVAVFFIAMLKR